jgi:hypothetical protein
MNLVTPTHSERSEETILGLASDAEYFITANLTIY